MKGKLVPGVLACLIAAEVLAQGCPPPANIPVGTCAPQTGTVVNFAGDTGQMRVRKSIYRLSAAEIAQLKLAFQRLRALPASDPRRWLAQANVHCWYCAGGSTTAQDVHFNWAFLPWHRVYLYNLEKTLGTLVNNPNFALPYWDWNTADTAGCTGHLRVPPPYLGGGTSNPLFDCYRNVTPTSTMNAASVGPARINTLLTNNNTFNLFFGTATTTSAVSPGPHGYVHLWVGNSPNLSIARQDMGVLETAARDPLFWAHHANIDRLWELWIARYGTPTYPAAFRSQNWLFWNQNRVRMRYTGGDAADRATRLRYRYDPPCGPIVVSPNLPNLVTLTPQPVTIRTEAMRPDRDFTIRGATGKTVVLNLEDVTVPADQPAILRVYVNKPNATVDAGEELPGEGRLVEELFIVPAKTPGTGHEGHEHTMHIKIALSPEIAAEVEQANGEVPVTIVPVAATPEGELEAIPAAVNVRLKKPYISVE